MLCLGCGGSLAFLKCISVFYFLFLLVSMWKCTKATVGENKGKESGAYMLLQDMWWMMRCLCSLEKLVIKRSSPPFLQADDTVSVSTPYLEEIQFKLMEKERKILTIEKLKWENVLCFTTSVNRPIVICTIYLCLRIITVPLIRLNGQLYPQLRAKTSAVL